MMGAIAAHRRTPYSGGGGKLTEILANSALTTATPSLQSEPEPFLRPLSGGLSPVVLVRKLPSVPCSLEACIQIRPATT